MDESVVKIEAFGRRWSVIAVIPIDNAGGRGRHQLGPVSVRCERFSVGERVPRPPP